MTSYTDEQVLERADEFRTSNPARLIMLSLLADRTRLQVALSHVQHELLIQAEIEGNTALGDWFSRLAKTIYSARAKKGDE